MDTYKDRIRADYDIEIYDDQEDIEDCIDDLGIDSDDYEVVSFMWAEAEKGDDFAYIAECGSASHAKELVKDLEDVIEDMKDYYEDLDIAVARDGKFVILGSQDAIDDVLGK